ncbi:MAG: histidinol-phosphatase HisJ family protein [Lachnospirales bacterium]
MKVDYHVHTNYSPDSCAKLEDVIKSAIEKNLDEICITDHIDNHPNQNAFLLPNYNSFFKELDLVKKKYPNISIKVGGELSLAPYLKEEVAKASKTLDYDFLIGSSHETNKDYLMTDSIFFKDKIKSNAFEIYFLEVLENVKIFNEFDVYGHLDYIFRYSVNYYEDNSFYYKDYAHLIDEILKTLIHKGKGIEINASGYRYGLNCFHPSMDILIKYNELGGEIVTIGSDAHSPQYVGTKYDEVIEYLKEGNTKYIATFNKRKVNFHKI